MMTNESYHRILSGYGGLGSMLASYADKGLTPEERLEMAEGLLEAAISKRSDDDVITMLGLLYQATRSAQPFSSAGEGRANRERFNLRLEEIFWKLPFSEPELYSPYSQHRERKGLLVKSRLFICRELIKEWTVTEMPQSVHAFRRLIAMGWPATLEHQRQGESDVEMRARNRMIFAKEREGILAIAREHLATFATHEEQREGPDAVFGPWLAHACVPDELRKLLVMARAKMGGFELTKRDIRNADILNGVPDSGLHIIRAIAERMWDAVQAGQVAGERVWEVIQVANPQYHYLDMHFDKAYSCQFTGEDAIAIEIGPLQVPPEFVFLAAKDVVNNIRARTALLRFNISLTVTGHSVVGDALNTPTKTFAWKKSN
jgi:hypothetical protein